MMQCHYLLNNSSHPFMLLCIHGGLWYWLTCCVLIARERDEKLLNRGHRGLYDGPWCFSLIPLIDCWETDSAKEMVDCLTLHTVPGGAELVCHFRLFLMWHLRNIRHLPPHTPILGEVKQIFDIQASFTCYSSKEEPQCVRMRSGGGGVGLITQPA